MIPDITNQGSAIRPSRRFSAYRAPFEFYPTPPEATRAFLAAETFDGDIWEPACGQGAISKVLLKSGYQVVSTDLADYGYGKPDVDFLQTKLPRAKHIVTIMKIEIFMFLWQKILYAFCTHFQVIKLYDKRFALS